MAHILDTKSGYFNDYNLIQQVGIVEHRGDIPNALHRIIASPMPSLVGKTFIVEAARLGISVAIPRWSTKKNKELSDIKNETINTTKKIELYKLFYKNCINPNKQQCFMTIGPNEPTPQLEYLQKTIVLPSLLIDFAHGGIPNLNTKIKRISKFIRPITLLIGNVTTSLTLQYLYNSGAEYCDNLIARIGVGNGAPCSSSDMTGVNRGQITELIECDNFRQRVMNWARPSTKLFLASDGGIYKPGFATKAIGAGADYCMMGGYFMNSLEAESHVTGDGTYFGCASEKQIELAGLTKTSEGKIKKIDKNNAKPLKKLVEDLWGGISSGISYCGYNSVESFRGNGIFEQKVNSLPPRDRS
jgi:hypothetical protein